MAGSCPALLRRAHQTAFGKHVEVMNDRRRCDAKRLGKARHRLRPTPQPIEHLPARRVAKRVEELIDGDSTLAHARTKSALRRSNNFSHPCRRICGPSAPSKNEP